METVNKNSASVLLCSYYVIKYNKSINLHHHHLNNKPASSIITLIEPNLARAGQKNSSVRINQTERILRYLKASQLLATPLNTEGSFLSAKVGYLLGWAGRIETCSFGQLHHSI